MAGCVLSRPNNDDPQQSKSALLHRSGRATIQRESPNHSRPGLAHYGRFVRMEKSMTLPPFKTANFESLPA